MAERIDLTEAPLPAAYRKKPKGGRGSGSLWWDRASRRVLGLSAPVFALLLLYALSGLWTGAWSHEAMGQMPAARRQVTLENVALVFHALEIAAAVAIASLLVCCARAEGLGYWLLGVAAFFYVGVPFVTTQAYLLKHLTQGGPGQAASAGFQSLAWLPAVPGALWTLVDLGRRLGEAAERAAIGRVNAKYGAGTAVQKSSTQRKVFLGRCWEGPFCKDHIRVHCPIYLKKQGPCWWYKEGCMCEEHIVLQAMIAPDWKDKMTRADQALKMGRAKPQHLSPEAKRERCRNCVIYNEHQRQKYKALTTTALIACPAFVLLNIPWLQGLVRQILFGLDAATKRFAFGSSPAGLTVLHTGEYGFIAWVFLFALGVVLLSQVLKAIEYFCFTLKL